MFYKDFYEKMGIQEGSATLRAVAYQLLIETVKGNEMKDKPEKSEICVPDGVSKPLLHLVDLAGSWTNDLMDVYREYCDEEGIGTDGELYVNGFKAIWQYLGIS